MDCDLKLEVSLGILGQYSKRESELGSRGYYNCPPQIFFKFLGLQNSGTKDTQAPNCRNLFLQP